MRHLLVLAFFTLISASFLPAQEDEIKENLASFKEAVKKKISADQIHFMEWFAKSWSKVDAKTRKKIHVFAKKNFKSKDAAVVEKTAVFLGQMGGGKKNADSDRAAAILLAQIKKKSVEKNIDLFATCVQSIGSLQSLKHTKDLTKLLNYKEYRIVAAAAEALANYRDFKHGVRKTIVSSVLKIYTSTANQARDPRNRVAKRKLSVIKGSMELCLRSLTGQNKSGSDIWWKWWQDVGKKSTKW